MFYPISKKLAGLFLLIGFTFSFAHPPHAFYVSIMEIIWEEEDEAGQVHIKIFSDDLEDAIYFRHSKRISVLQSLDNPETIMLITNYLQSCVSINLDGKAVLLNYEKGEVLQDAVTLKFSINKSGLPKEITIQNSILTEIFDTQANIIRFDIAGQKKILKLDKETTQGIQRF